MHATVSLGSVSRLADCLDDSIIPCPEGSKAFMQHVVFVEDVRVRGCNRLSLFRVLRAKIWIEDP